jgi:putative exporter of polyketide antibiotics
MINGREFSYYPGDDGNSEFLFTTDSWIEFQRQLTTADIVMRMLALRHRMKFSTNIKGHWPSRRLRKKNFFKFYELSLTLNRNYLMDGIIFYELNKFVSLNLFGIFEKVLEFTHIRNYSTDQVNDKNVLLNDLESTITSL